MGTVIDVLGTMKKVDAQRICKSVIGRTSDQYLDLNREQLLEGRRADGSVMPNYSWISVKVYGKPDGPIMLFDTGAFHGSFKLDVGSQDLEILANDEHNLEDRFGDEIYGLTPNSQEYYNQEIFLPELKEEITTITGLEFN